MIELHGIANVVTLCIGFKFFVWQCIKYVKFTGYCKVCKETMA